ncbi:hypothetical protein BUALT_Bualt11G0117000 [Buddleja alternifolia]|uniref:DUF4378 domain-containing protein n=1 Tax=Buddleja alternifolia TaxID=168488 RepID=A0AAV6X1K0_9LAMI|nr:hypothetical protein BUALT_Bualt11G0117000 [Buddleja alternifolia]
MEITRHRRSKSASGIEGIRQFQNHKAFSRFSPEYRSYIDERTRDDDMFTLELGQSSLRRATGRPRKKLLAEEMYKEVESKRRSPSIIARLVGLEGLLSPGHHKQQKRLSDSCQQKNASISIQPNRQTYDGRSNRRSSTEQQEFRDVHEDFEASHLVNRRCSSRWSANSILTKHEMALIQQKYKDAKHISTNGKFRGSIELGDTSGMLDLDNVNHLHDLQVNPSSTLVRDTAVLKPRSSAKYEGNFKAWKSERDTSKKNTTSHLEREDGLLLERHNYHRARISHQSSKIQLEEKHEKKILPTRIVVLKPNLGNIHNVGISGSSPDYSHGYWPNFREPEEYVGGVETVSWRRKDSSCDVGLSKPASKEAREIAREITRRMRGGCDETVDAKSSGFRGYAGDESSYDAHDSDFDSEIEMFKLVSRNSFGDDNKRCRKYPACSLVEWSLREAKKRLSERWKMTRRYQDLELVGQSKTLGEMLAIPDKEARPKCLNAKTRNDPLGISSRDGWKDEINRTSSRSRSLPPSTDGGSQRRGTHHEALAGEKHVMRSEPIRLGRVKIAKRNRSHKEVFSSQDSKSRSKKSLPCESTHIKERESSSEANFEIEMEANIKDLSHQMSRMAAKGDPYESPVSEVIMTAEHGSRTLSPKASHLVPKQPSSVVDNGKAAIRDQKDSSLQKRPPEQGSPSLQYLLAEPDTSESSKEADHTSPVSVFEVPFTEDTSSSSESFERVNAELHELRMQLQLLKMESCSYADVSTLASIEKEIALLYSLLSEGNNILGAESWEISYALDVLIECGLQESGFDMFVTKWHSPDCPLDPKLFNNLEKNYSDDNIDLRLERRLIFDRLNWVIVEIFQQNVDFCPWVMPKLTGLSRQKERVIESLGDLINRVFANVEITERVLDREMLWSNYRGEIDEIGNEIEKLLIDDMINEFISY